MSNRVKAAKSSDVFEDIRPGAFQIIRGEAVKVLAFRCPGGCGELHQCPIRNLEAGIDGWQWNKNEERPTLKPSIKIRQELSVKGCDWHGWLTDGEFIEV